jgi:hypothetical protein
MADRTLRRAYAGTNGIAAVDAIADGSNKGSEQDASGAIEQPSDSTVADGSNDERNIDSVSSVRIVEIDPEQLGDYVNGTGTGSDSTDEPRKRRGRKPGTKNRTSTGSKNATETVAPFITMLHQGAAIFLKTPELMLDEKEAKQLSDAYSEFCVHHNVPVLSDKRLSEVNMITAMMMVYAPRIIAIRNRVREEKKVTKARNVTPIQ